MHLGQRKIRLEKKVRGYLQYDESKISHMLPFTDVSWHGRP